jgi:hypothetical protein
LPLARHWPDAQTKRKKQRLARSIQGVLTSKLASYATLRRPEDVDRYEEGLRLHGDLNAAIWRNRDDNVFDSALLA